MLRISPAPSLRRAFLKSFLRWLRNNRSDFLEFVRASWNLLMLLHPQRWEAWGRNGATVEESPRKINGGELKKKKKAD